MNRQKRTANNWFSSSWWSVGRSLNDAVLQNILCCYVREDVKCIQNFVRKICWKMSTGETKEFDLMTSICILGLLILGTGDE